MVNLTKCLFYGKSSKKIFTTGFRDTLRIFAQAGHGGNGLPNLGGVGGQGGNVIAVAVESITLDEVKKRNQNMRYIAENGRNSSKNFILGPAGESIRIELPVGITAYTDEGKKLGELNKAGEEVVLLKGGSGGHAKNGYLGRQGQHFPIKLELKTIADIGLVGFPNAGKSTLLKAVTAAKPETNRYPFTTVKPITGIMSFKDQRQITMVDLPGLINGAHANQGLGHKFLKHLDHTQLLLFVVDINGFKLDASTSHLSCLETIVVLNKELELYNSDLLKKPAVIIINKMDKKNSSKLFECIKEQLNNLSEVSCNYPEKLRPTINIKFEEIMPVSLKNASDRKFVKTKLRKVLDIQADIQREKLVDENIKLIRETKRSLKEVGPKLI